MIQYANVKITIPHEDKKITIETKINKNLSIESFELHLPVSKPTTEPQDLTFEEAEFISRYEDKYLMHYSMHDSAVEKITLHPSASIGINCELYNALFEPAINTLNNNTLFKSIFSDSAILVHKFSDLTDFFEVNNIQLHELNDITNFQSDTSPLLGEIEIIYEFSSILKFAD